LAQKRYEFLYCITTKRGRSTGKDCSILTRMEFFWTKWSTKYDGMSPVSTMRELDSQKRVISQLTGLKY